MRIDRRRLQEQLYRLELLNSLELGWRSYFIDDVQGNVRILQTILGAIDAIAAGEQSNFEQTGNAWSLRLSREEATAEPFYGGYTIRADLGMIRTFVVRYLQSLHDSRLLDQGARLLQSVASEWQDYIDTDIGDQVGYLEEILDEIEEIKSGRKDGVRMTSDWMTLHINEQGATVDNSYLSACPRWNLEEFRVFLVAYTDFLRSYLYPDSPEN